MNLSEKKKRDAYHVILYVLLTCTKHIVSFAPRMSFLMVMNTKVTFFLMIIKRVQVEKKEKRRKHQLGSVKHVMLHDTCRVEISYAFKMFTHHASKCIHTHIHIHIAYLWRPLYVPRPSSFIKFTMADDEYERERQENIRKNRELMLSLGLNVS